MAAHAPFHPPRLPTPIRRRTRSDRPVPPKGNARFSLLRDVTLASRESRRPPPPPGARKEDPDCGRVNWKSGVGWGGKPFAVGFWGSTRPPPSVAGEGGGPGVRLAPRGAPRRSSAGNPVVAEKKGFSRPLRAPLLIFGEQRPSSRRHPPFLGSSA